MRIRYVAPVVISAVLVALMAAIAAVMFWGYSVGYVVDPSEVPPLAVILVLEALPLLVIVGVLLALFQRIKEIGRGEIDDAKQY